MKAAVVLYEGRPVDVIVLNDDEMARRLRDIIQVAADDIGVPIPSVEELLGPNAEPYPPTGHDWRDEPVTYITARHLDLEVYLVDARVPAY